MKRQTMKTGWGSRKTTQTDIEPSHFEKADKLRDEKDWNGAASAYAAGLASDPFAFDMWVQYGHALKEAGEMDKAGKAYLHALSLDKDNVDLHVQLGHFHKLAGDLDATRFHYVEAVKLGSDDPHALGFLNPMIGKDVVDRLLTFVPDPRRRSALLTAWVESRSFTELILVATETA